MKRKEIMLTIILIILIILLIGIVVMKYCYSKESDNGEESVDTDETELSTIEVSFDEQQVEDIIFKNFILSIDEDSNSSMLSYDIYNIGDDAYYISNYSLIITDLNGDVVATVDREINYDLPSGGTYSAFCFIDSIILEEYLIEVKVNE